MKGLWTFLAGFGAACAFALLTRGRARGMGVRGAAAATGITRLDLNSASQADLEALGIESTLADRIVEQRPYRNKLELLERYVVGQALYEQIKDRVSVGSDEASKPIQVAS